MDLTDPNDLQLALRLSGIRPSKTLGQHFLVDRDSLNDIMKAGELTAHDTVLEIGPGLGVMTIPLTGRVKHVIAVEADKGMTELLARDRPKNLEIVEQDFTKFDLTQLPKNYKVVANIPYYLTSKIMRLLLESPNPPKVISVLIQKEVAHRIAAAPGSMSVLALSVQYYGKPEVVGEVERHKFWPPPKVDSAILKVALYDKPIFSADTGKLFRLIKAGFGEKRKMLRNSLAGGLNISIELAAGLVKQAGLVPTARAQELSLGQWEKLYTQAIKADIF